MKRRFQLLNQCLDNHRLTIGVVSLFLGMTTVALADYKPPDPPSRPKEPTIISGTRGGCSKNGKAKLTTLAPQEHIGQTVSTHPTFAWFVPDAESLPMKFQLYQVYQDDVNENHQLIQNIELQTTPGIMTHSLSQDELGLSVGQRYFWQVVIICEPNHPSSAIVAQGYIDVVQESPDLKIALAAATNPVDRANIYADRGFWYDGFGEVVGSGDDARHRELKLNLLTDLAKIEASGNSHYASQKSERIKQILEIERKARL
ncbi:DUF928 domain-containing protein [Moorena sp. SIO4G3]|uniref:DUF928 domain-containing protein n=1 Tax=Moorena sp. SIO4G3 TaxID=2607821 RepID=UPI00142B13ED|nr:DUF928 domain-containing protein [Moorena sp. SIO4G3]NEO82490.1 DUF928 domain-containing protein [Moorena sp. SIO4G3]